MQLGNTHPSRQPLTFLCLLILHTRHLPPRRRLCLARPGQVTITATAGRQLRLKLTKENGESWRYLQTPATATRLAAGPPPSGTRTSNAASKGAKVPSIVKGACAVIRALILSTCLACHHGISALVAPNTYERITTVIMSGFMPVCHGRAIIAACAAKRISRRPLILIISICVGSILTTTKEAILRSSSEMKT